MLMGLMIVLLNAAGVAPTPAQLQDYKPENNDGIQHKYKKNKDLETMAGKVCPNYGIIMQYLSLELSLTLMLDLFASREMVERKQRQDQINLKQQHHSTRRQKGTGRKKHQLAKKGPRER